MRFERFKIVKSNSSQDILLIVVFDDEGVEKEWMPKWEDVRSLIKKATLIEYANNKGMNNKELVQFGKTILFMDDVLSCRYEEEQ